MRLMIVPLMIHTYILILTMIIAIIMTDVSHSVVLDKGRM